MKGWKALKRTLIKPTFRNVSKQLNRKQFKEFQDIMNTPRPIISTDFIPQKFIDDLSGI